MKVIAVQVFKMFIALLIATMLSGLMSYVWADHNYDPNNPATQIDRGYNRENCEKWVSKESGDHGKWLGHLVGCLMDGKIYGEFTVDDTEKI